jgi:multimeric flavodoxin WrbA
VLGTKLKGGVVLQIGENQKHVVVLLGSPRKKGNSTVLAKQIIHGVESVSAKVETVYLNGLNIKPCQGCYACKKKNSTGCAVDDDMQSLYPKLVESDAWVIASPVYWFSMSAPSP